MRRLPQPGAGQQGAAGRQGAVGLRAHPLPRSKSPPCMQQWRGQEEAREHGEQRQDGQGPRLEDKVGDDAVELCVAVPKPLLHGSCTARVLSSHRPRSAHGQQPGTLLLTGEGRGDAPSALKFAAVLGTSLPYKPRMIRPAGLPPTVRSMKTLSVTSGASASARALHRQHAVGLTNSGAEKLGRAASAQVVQLSSEKSTALGKFPSAGITSEHAHACMERCGSIEGRMKAGRTRRPCFNNKQVGNWKQAP